MANNQRKLYKKKTSKKEEDNALLKFKGLLIIAVFIIIVFFIWQVVIYAKKNYLKTIRLLSLKRQQKYRVLETLLIMLSHVLKSRTNSSKRMKLTEKHTKK